MARNLAELTQRWSRRTSFRLRDSALERTQGIALYVCALLGPLLLAILPPVRPLIVFAVLGFPLFFTQATALLFTVPSWWERTASWLHDRAPKWVYLAFVVSVGLVIVWFMLADEHTDGGILVMCLALAARTAASLTEPRSSGLDERPYAGRIRRASVIHGGFMVVFAVGAAITLGSAVRSMGQAVPVPLYASLTIATGAFFFKVHQRIRRTCIRTYDRIGTVLNELAYLDRADSPKDLEAAIRVLNRTLATPVQTVFLLWGTPIVPVETRIKVIDWLNERAAESIAVRDSGAPEYQALLAITDVCTKWPGED